MSLPTVIQTTGVVIGPTHIQLSGNLPEKERIRVVYHDFPLGTQLNVELFYSVDNFHGIEFHDYLLKSLEPISKS